MRNTNTHNNGRRSASVLLTALAALTTLLVGCAPKEAAVPQRTVSVIDAEIQKVQSNANMPPQAKAMALGALQRERAQVLKTGGK